jgi:molecular chaperone GrpE
MSAPENEDSDDDDAGRDTATGLTPVEGPEDLKRECADLREQLLRKRAEFENYKKRVERDRASAGVEAAASVLKGLIPTIDNLDRALAAASREDPLRAGVELIRRDLQALLEAQGVTIEDPTGQKFDPESHQALSHEPVAGFAEDTVVEVFGKGYRFRDRLLRPALVKVAADAAGVVH